MGLLFATHTTNIAREQVEDFLHRLLRRIRGPVVLLWDNAKTHNGPLVWHIADRNPRLRIEQLPPYAPELNPDEGVWNQTKRSLANRICRSADSLEASVSEALTALSASQAHLRACVHRSGLKFF